MLDPSTFNPLHLIILRSWSWFPRTQMLDAYGAEVLDFDTIPWARRGRLGPRDLVSQPVKRLTPLARGVSQLSNFLHVGFSAPVASSYIHNLTRQGHMGEDRGDLEARGIETNIYLGDSVPRTPPRRRSLSVVAVTSSGGVFFFIFFMRGVLKQPPPPRRSEDSRRRCRRRRGQRQTTWATDDMLCLASASLAAGVAVCAMSDDTGEGVWTARGWPGISLASPVSNGPWPK